MIAKSNALEKIRKCLALAKSNNANESATAMRQARALMDKFDLEVSDVELAEFGISTCVITKKPAKGIIMLMTSVARAFGCSVFHRERRGVFVGNGMSHEIAAYTFTVVLQHLKLAWNERAGLPDVRFLRPHQRTALKKAFEIGFATGVHTSVVEFAAAVTDEINSMHCAKLERETGAQVYEVKTRKTTLSPTNFAAYQQAIAEGKKVRLHQPLDSSQNIKLLAGI